MISIELVSRRNSSKVSRLTAASRALPDRPNSALSPMTRMTLASWVGASSLMSPDLSK